MHSHDNYKGTAEFAAAEKALVDSIDSKIGNNVADADMVIEDFGEIPDLFNNDDCYDDSGLIDPRFDKPEVDDFTPEAYNKYLSVNVLLPCRDSV